MRPQSWPRTRSDGTNPSIKSSHEHGPVFDALELVSNNVDRQTRAKTQALLREQPMGTTGSSDAHEIDVLGCYFSEFPNRIESISDFVAALRARQGRPGNRVGVHLSSGPVDGGDSSR